MITSHPYTVEGADSARQSAHDKSVPDPTAEQAKAAIDANTLTKEILVYGCRWCGSHVESSLLTGDPSVCGQCRLKGKDQWV